MRHLLPALMLLSMLSVMNLLAAPIPEPYAILELPAPPKGVSPEQYARDQIRGTTSRGTLNRTMTDEVRKLPSILHLEDARPWLAKHLQVTQEDGGRRLRFTFGAGTRAEQVIILNAFLRASLSWQEESIKWAEECIRIHEKKIPELEKRIELSRDPQDIMTYQRGIDELRSIRIPDCRAEIARLKQFVVSKWAK